MPVIAYLSVWMRGVATSLKCLFRDPMTLRIKMVSLNSTFSFLQGILYSQHGRIKGRSRKSEADFVIHLETSSEKIQGKLSEIWTSAQILLTWCCNPDYSKQIVKRCRVMSISGNPKWTIDALWNLCPTRAPNIPRAEPPFFCQKFGIIISRR